MFESVEDVEVRLREQGYICGKNIATVVYLAAQLEKPVLVEGPAGVGKTELAKVVAAATGRNLIRLQCYEGLDEAKALYEWEYSKQLLYTQILKEKMAETMAGATSLRDAAERVGNEVQAAMAAPRPDNFPGLLATTGALAPWFEEWTSAGTIPAGPPAYHDGSVLEHTMAVMARLAGAPLAVWMGWCHDIGKTATASARLPHHHGHEQVGERLAHAMGKRLRLPQRFIRAGAAAARWHMVTARYPELKVGTRVDLLVRLKALNLVAEMAALAAADKPGVELACMADDLETILAVHLLPEETGRGALSGTLLRQRRCQALGRQPATPDRP